MNVKKTQASEVSHSKTLQSQHCPYIENTPLNTLAPVHGRRFILRALGIVEEEQLPEGLTRLTRLVIVF
jgi:hypothetical protein